MVKNKMTKKFNAVIFLSLLFLLAAIITACVFGTVSVNPFDGSSVSSFIIWQIRIPRVFLAAIVGAMLSVSGVVLQGVLLNPLSDPFILGVSAGGGLGAAIAMVFNLPFFFVPLFAFIGAAASVLIVYQISKISGHVKPQTLILAGVAVSSFIGAFLTMIVFSSDKLRSIYFWTLGSFAFADWSYVKIAFICLLAGYAASVIFSKQLNAMQLGEYEAMSLGVDIKMIRILLLTTASLLAGVSVALCGMIGFVGLIVPHISRLIVGRNNSFVIPVSSILGAALLVTADLISRTIFIPSEVPVGIITAMLGAPFFIYLLRKVK